jgi:hypothetical protein
LLLSKVIRNERLPGDFWTALYCHSFPLIRKTSDKGFDSLRTKEIGEKVFYYFYVQSGPKKALFGTLFLPH